MAAVQRGRVMGSLTIIAKFVSTVTQNTATSEIEVRLNKLDDLWKEFQEYESQVATILANTPTASVELKQEEFENKFFDTKSKLLDLCRERQPQVGSQPVNTNSFDQLLDQQRVFLESLADRTQAINDRSFNQSSDSLKLPRVHIDKFTGEYESWPSFYDLYTSSVNNIETISKVHKFQILKGLLEGPPLHIIRNFLVTDNNYCEAWEKLVSRYNKKKPILNTHIERFFDQPSAVDGSVQSLRLISDTSDEILRGIKALGTEAETRDPWLIRILLNKIDEETRSSWATETLNDTFPTIDKFLNFLNNRCYVKESASANTKKRGIKGSSGAIVKSMHGSSNVMQCPCCKHPQVLWRCLKFKRLSIENRQLIVTQSELCSNCLREGHTVNQCPVDYSCRICNARHSTFLHVDIESATSTQSSVSSVAQTDKAAAASQHTDTSTVSLSDSSPVSTSLNVQTSRLALLPTVLVHIQDSAGNLHLARALLDSGSQSSFISERLVQKLNLARSFANVRISGISGSKAEIAKGVVNATIQSRFVPSERFQIEALILTKLTSTVPQVKIESQWVNDMIHRNLQLADPAYYIPSEIEILLGADMFFEVLNTDQIKIKNRLIAQSSKFGWVISGVAHQVQGHPKSLTATVQVENVSKLLERFWLIEELPSATVMSVSESLCEKHFSETHSRNSSGRYVVKLPFNMDVGDLGESKPAAIKRLLTMERKFRKFPNLQKEYNNFMTEYAELGHMQEIKPTEPKCDCDQHFYLPHHAVVNDTSSTTKLRVVFDGSCKTASGISLNDKLLVGPTIQKDLTSILLLFRKHAIAFSSDVEKMYRQVELHKQDQNYQRILWRSSPAEPMRDFKLNTVTYGTSCAPFLAVRTLQQIAEDYKHMYPIGARIAQQDFYVDDCLSGADTIDEAKTAVREISEMLIKGGFNLRKWKTNSPELLSMIPPKFREINHLHIDDGSGTVKTLGLLWNPKKDTFAYKLKLEDKPETSKREMLSQIGKIFDPLGWVSPAIIIFKITLQKLWLRKLGWDDRLPADIEQPWRTNKSLLRELEEIEVPRFLLTSKSTCNSQIHGFCDASEHAYAAVVYLRTTDINKNVNTRIVMSKTKVAPLKQVSLPRLELCGAVLLSRLLKYITNTLEINTAEYYAWTDSKIVLSWLADIPRRWKCFIANRTSEILENTPHVEWKYVSSKDNPADMASRGVTPKQLLDSRKWWSGPDWLIKIKEEWPSTVKVEQTNLEERHISLLSNVKISPNQVLEDLFSRIESFSKIKRIMTRVLCVRKAYRFLDTVELFKKAEKVCLKWAQSAEFDEEIRSLNQNKEIGPKSKIISLSPFIDQEEILRVGGRLKHLDAVIDIKHPIILPKIHLLNDKIIQETHIRYMHPGPTLHISILRQKYWILNCRNAVRNHINKCVICRRQRAATSQQLMGSLPKSRITPSRPFLHTGVDYAGPLYLKTRTGRGRIPIVKGYICIFVCFATKAIHIELCHDMTAEAFIAALRRFTSRRGIPAELISDNGTNFVGAKRELEILNELYTINYKHKLISDFISQNEIKFSFNPASGPHFGGLWESGVKSIKHHLNRVTGSTSMTSNEMNTLLVQIEGLLNSRPLCPMSNEIDDLFALTPAHFLIGESLTAIPEPSLEHIPTNRLSRWQNIQARMQGFWKKWQMEYLHTATTTKMD